MNLSLLEREEVCVKAFRQLDKVGAGWAERLRGWWSGWLVLVACDRAMHGRAARGGGRLQAAGWRKQAAPHLSATLPLLHAAPARRTAAAR